MEKVFDSEQYGHIVCTQNFFGELKSVSINGERLKTDSAQMCGATYYPASPSA